MDSWQVCNGIFIKKPWAGCKSMQQQELNFSRPILLRKSQNSWIKHSITIESEIIAKGVISTAWFTSSRFTVNLERSETWNADTELGRRHKGILNK